MYYSWPTSVGDTHKLNGVFWYYTIITHEIVAEDHKCWCVGFSFVAATSSKHHSDFEKIDVPEIELMHVNASSSFEMNCTYPPHSKKP